MAACVGRLQPDVVEDYKRMYSTDNLAQLKSKILLEALRFSRDTNFAIWVNQNGSFIQCSSEEELASVKNQYGEWDVNM
jgi:hypothetical protein